VGLGLAVTRGATDRHPRVRGLAAARGSRAHRERRAPGAPQLGLLPRPGRELGRPMSAATPLRARRDPPATDAELLVRVAKEELGALGELFDRHAAEVRAFATRLVGPTDADDVVQETFVRVSRLAAGFDGRASARAWL